MATEQRGKLELFVNSGTIVDQHGKPWTPEEARVAWQEGRVANWNLAFQRLAGPAFDFDLEKLRAFYAAH
jgi:hypothetical protein